MKKFKFILLFVAALGMGLTSCSKDDDETPVDVTPNIDFKGGNEYISADAVVTAGQDFTIGITASSNANSGKKLKSVKYTVTSNNVVVLEFDSVFNETSYNLDYVFNMSDPGAGVFKFVVTDKDDQTNTISLTVTAESADTPLGVAEDTYFERVGGAAGTGLDGFGLKWTSNVERATYAVLAKDAATKLVQLTAAEWTSITTVEALTAAVDAAADMADFRGISTSADGDYDDVLGVIYNGEYYMIHLTSATVAVDAVNGTTVKIYGQSKK
ncbi:MULTISPECIES: hypothetical protein [unclassified Lentimicrobium]|uniref:hypothetical protein n=1 Tax=unclassified Lentimicrobium TaxID=2677434 RepID=UPI001554F6AE|nr:MULTISPECIES: hypothetical protein [unclassified Lentimicrobium]NPD44132.1 hypothetical protein [Lentimicrobium sp. S6]NPD86719.1 hypothetical protein [Lentimicrobium sp. L6]